MVINAYDEVLVSPQWLVPSAFGSTTLLLCYYDITCDKYHVCFLDSSSSHLYHKHTILMILIIIIINKIRLKCKQVIL